MSTKSLPPEFPDPQKSATSDASQRAFTRRDFVRLASAVGAATAAIGGSDLLTETVHAGVKPRLAKPTINCGASTQASINIVVTAGANGLPAGFSLQWMTAADYAVAGWPSNSDCLPDDYGNPTCPASFCKGSFSGNANLSNYNLAAGASVTVNVGDFLFDNGASTNCPLALVCGTDYVFRAFGHANASFLRSDFTADLTCSTLACDASGNCTFTQGYWKTHGPGECLSGNNADVWPVTSLTLGTVSYDADELCSILNTPAQGNGLISLAHQLIAAKLNVANGADDSAVATAIAQADTKIGAQVIPEVGAGYLAPSVTSALTTTLTNYNEGAIGPGHCA